eukprot:gene22515-biopygen8767
MAQSTVKCQYLWELSFLLVFGIRTSKLEAWAAGILKKNPELARAKNATFRWAHGGKTPKPGGQIAVGWAIWRACPSPSRDYEFQTADPAAARRWTRRPQRLPRGGFFFLRRAAAVALGLHLDSPPRPRAECSGFGGDWPELDYSPASIRIRFVSGARAVVRIAKRHCKFPSDPPPFVTKYTQIWYWATKLLPSPPPHVWHSPALPGLRGLRSRAQRRQELC